MKKYKNILVAIDFSAVSEKLIEKALLFSSSFDSEISLLHVIDYSPPSYVVAEIPQIYTSESLMTQRAEKNIQDMVASYTDLKPQIIVRVGKARSTIAIVANEVDADLVILGKHDPSAIDKFLGSTTHAALNSMECDLLVLHG